MQTTRYTIHDITEETSCDWCGCPLYIGDRAYPTTDENAVFCCAADREAWLREARLHPRTEEDEIPHPSQTLSCFV